jgi:hypothetical protein
MSARDSKALIAASLEKEATHLIEYVAFGVQDMVAVSLAISMKRIADELERPRREAEQATCNAKIIGNM